jgi:hypothetical protein
MVRVARFFAIRDADWGATVDPSAKSSARQRTTDSPALSRRRWSLASARLMKSCERDAPPALPLPVRRRGWYNDVPASDFALR